MREFFNTYVREVFPDRRAAAAADWQWPGDEWADTALRETTWRWIEAHLPGPLSNAIEIGPGSGKYTDLLLRRTSARVTAYEISDAFVESLCERCHEDVASGRLVARRIDWTDNEGLIRCHGNAAGTDLMLAIDVFLMMDFQSVLAYLATAAIMLRPGGRLLATFGDGGSESGLARMMRDLGRHSAIDPAPCTRFHWIDASMLLFVLPKLGFGQVDIVRGPNGGLDIARLYVAAELVDADLGHRAAAHLAPVGGDSTNRLKTLA